MQQVTIKILRTAGTLMMNIEIFRSALSLHCPPPPKKKKVYME